MFRVIIAGSRHYGGDIAPQCDQFLRNKAPDIQVLSGTAHGVDRAGEDYARLHHYRLLQYPADWTRHGKSAGYIRNQEMAKNADALIAFWDGTSRGTAHMIMIAYEAKLLLRVVVHGEWISDNNEVYRRACRVIRP